MKSNSNMKVYVVRTEDGVVVTQLDERGNTVAKMSFYGEVASHPELPKPEPVKKAPVKFHRDRDRLLITRLAKDLVRQGYSLTHLGIIFRIDRTTLSRWIKA